MEGPDPGKPRGVKSQAKEHLLNPGILGALA